MEPLTMFAWLVGFICVFHLISTTINKVTKGRKVKNTTTRTDWYCFFYRSDLIGKDISANKKQDDMEKNVYDAHIEQRRRGQAQRPRLQV